MQENVRSMSLARYLACWISWKLRPEEFLSVISSEGKLTCHSAVDYDDDDWDSEDKMKSYPHCAGSLLATQKMCKIPRDPEHAQHVQDAQDESNHIHPFKFVAYHRSSSS